jgi:hypothetical protein
LRPSFYRQCRYRDYLHPTQTPVVRLGKRRGTLDSSQGVGWVTSTLDHARREVDGERENGSIEEE